MSRDAGPAPSRDLLPRLGLLVCVSDHLRGDGKPQCEGPWPEHVTQSLSAQIGESNGGSQGPRCHCDDGWVETGRTTAIRAAPWARFDVILGTGLMFTCSGRVLVANSANEVAPVLSEVDKATREGSWAFGYVACEAAPGLDSGLAVCDRRPSSAPWCGSGYPTNPCGCPRSRPRQLRKGATGPRRASRGGPARNTSVMLPAPVSTSRQAIPTSAACTVQLRSMVNGDSSGTVR